MSVKKYIISKNSGSFTTIPNKVLQNLKNYEALGLYSYLASLPPAWEFHKSQLSAHGKIGRDKLNNAFKILAQHGLVKIAQVRNEKGQFAHYDVCVDDGTNFKINDLDKNAQPRTEKPLTDNQSLDNSSYKGNKDKPNKKQKENISCASDDARSKSFENFWNIYPKKKDKARTKEIWKRKNCEDIADLIIKDVQTRILNEFQWKEDQFIPYPSTYLRNERWNDELTLEKVNNKKEHNDHPVTQSIRDLKAKSSELNYLLS